MPDNNVIGNPQPAITLHPVNLSHHLQTCLEFRRDAWNLSFGNLDTFSAANTLRWFYDLAQQNPDGFLHAYRQGNIIGQLEFKSNIDITDGKMGYINLIYLLPQWRRQGFGQIMHDYVIRHFDDKHCGFARLRYLPRNLAAGNFYIKNGWHKVGEPRQDGQLMEKTIGI